MPGRAFVVSSVPFANPGHEVNSVDNVSRVLRSPLVTTVTSMEWSFLYSQEPGKSQLYHLPSDARQENDVIFRFPDVARDHHRMLVEFMTETKVRPSLVEARKELHM
jgi:hypothetical protein